MHRLAGPNCRLAPTAIRIVAIIDAFVAVSNQQTLVRDNGEAILVLGTRKAESQRRARTMAELAARTKTTMQEFLRRATAAKIDRLSSLVTESFRFLLRKQTLVEQIMIDPQTFAITLFGADGHTIAKQRLGASARREGDRHIFPGCLVRR
jgi:DNA sulfur modification protein DndD